MAANKDSFRFIRIQFAVKNFSISNPSSATSQALNPQKNEKSLGSAERLSGKGNSLRWIGEKNLVSAHFFGWRISGFRAFERIKKRSETAK